MTSRLLAVVVALGCLALFSPTAVEAQSATDLMKKGTDAAKLAQPLDLNSASVSDLKKLPGVGDSAAKKIVAGRPFTNTSELVDKKILSAVAYDKVKGLVTVK
jgi:competence protein ComEA